VLHAQDTAIAYSPYGHRDSVAGLPGLPGFNGEQPDPVTGHYLLGNGYRAYNPILMRFNSPDSLSPFGEGGMNAYAYCVGDPVNRSDPTGHFGGLPSVISKLFGPVISRGGRALSGLRTRIGHLARSEHVSSAVAQPGGAPPNIVQAPLGSALSRASSAAPNQYLESLGYVPPRIQPGASLQELAVAAIQRRQRMLPLDKLPPPLRDRVLTTPAFGFRDVRANVMNEIRNDIGYVRRNVNAPFPTDDNYRALSYAIHHKLDAATTRQGRRPYYSGSRGQLIIDRWGDILDPGRVVARDEHIRALGDRGRIR
jgi:RHS repeat-associated protein